MGAWKQESTYNDEQLQLKCVDGLLKYHTEFTTMMLSVYFARLSTTKRSKGERHY